MVGVAAGRKPGDWGVPRRYFSSPQFTKDDARLLQLVADSFGLAIASPHQFARDGAQLLQLVITLGW